MKINSPILYCCYNRLDLIKKSIKHIQNIDCKKIYLAIDGPKNTQLEKNKNKKIIEFLNKVKFKSKKVFLIRKKNLGCKLSISGAIDWFFKFEESGIILEDDMIPSKSFFKFCDFALKKYSDCEKIMMISGTNYLGEKIISNKYFFSEHFLIWGWATWKRSWKKYDVEMKKWKNTKVKNKLKKRYDRNEYNFLKNRFNSFFTDYSDTWDIQWYFACILNKGLTVMPEANLVSNIGIEGTHSKKYYKKLFLKYGKFQVNKIVDPEVIERNNSFDKNLHRKFNYKNKILLDFKKLIKKILNFN